ncbi:hypothetical protein [Streptomyces profundus]|uniref:hypothetical protein n=1 Tax=Streptomyces profundus TaxID=2867410 RepID=UPI001D1653EA|nr:hypothetical protein [Streptomyces sp. MA3_2.13]UED85748.1 hypothetical protein K4G22_17390 [Streptomyces sp. MA3_2.13]
MTGYGYPNPQPYPVPQPPQAAFPQQIHIIGIAGGALATVCSLLAWTRVEGDSIREGMPDGIRGTSGDGVWTLILGLVVVGLCIGAKVAKKPLLNAIAGVPGLIAAFIAFVNLASPERLARTDLESEMSITDAQWEVVMGNFDFTSHLGIYGVTAGALASVVAGILAATNLKK